MRKDQTEKQLQDDFVEFIEVNSVAPSKDLDTKIFKIVERDLRPFPLKVYGKFTLIESFAGLLTLTVCPQFGFGLGHNNEFLHSLHAATTPIIFYLVCGVFFVLLGAILSGLIFTREEVKIVGYKKYVFFGVFSILAYLALLMLGTEAFAVHSLAWVLGASLGNVLGFESAYQLRRMLT